MSFLVARPACMLSCFSPVQLFATLWSVACQAPLSMGFSTQEYWSGLPCPPPGDLLHPRIEPVSLMSPALARGFFTTSTKARQKLLIIRKKIIYIYYVIQKGDCYFSRLVMSDSFATPWTIQPTRLLCPWDFPNKNIGMGCHFLLHGLFLTQELNPHLLHWQVGSSPLSHLGSHYIKVAFLCTLQKLCPSLVMNN